MTNSLNMLLGGLPIAPTPVTPPLNLLLKELYRRPRNRSEWQARFRYWQRPASKTEEAKIEATARRVAAALRHSAFLPQRQWRVVKKGSYHDNTNVRVDSDMDLGVCLTDAFFMDGPQSDFPTLGELGREPLPFRFDQYKAHIAWCLQQEFGARAITIGKKAIQVHKDDNEKIHADVVPAFTFQLYGPRSGPFGLRGVTENGIALITSEGRRITNFPDQHYANGCAKNDRTRRRYKRVVRILKRLRNHIAENPDAPQSIRAAAKSTASFLIDCLVYNCPDTVFENAEIYDDVVGVLRYLSAVLNDPADGRTLLGMPSWVFWREVNGIKPLFGLEQAWTVAGAASFIGYARAYMEV